MAADPANSSTSGIHVQSCGDSHLMNFGGFGTPERRIVFDINDFDETHLAHGNGMSKDWRPVLSSPDDIIGSRKKRCVKGFTLRTKLSRTHANICRDGCFWYVV